MGERLITVEERKAVRRALATALKRECISHSELSAETGWDNSAIGKALSLTNPANLAYPISVDRLVEVDRYLGDPVGTRVVARMLGHALTPLPHIDPGAQGAEAMAAFFKEVGEAVSKAGDMLADDGQMTGKDDLAAFIAELDGAADAIAAIKAVAVDIAEREGAS